MSLRGGGDRLSPHLGIKLARLIGLLDEPGRSDAAGMDAADAAGMWGRRPPAPRGDRGSRRASRHEQLPAGQTPGSTGTSAAPALAVAYVWDISRRLSSTAAPGPRATS